MKMKIPFFTMSLILILAFLITYYIVGFILKVEKKRETLRPGVYPLTQDKVLLEDMYKLNKIEEWGVIPEMDSDRYKNSRVHENPDNSSCTPKDVCRLYE